MHDRNASMEQSEIMAAQAQGKKPRDSNASAIKDVVNLGHKRISRSGDNVNI